MTDEQKSAEVVALRALAWLAADDELWPVFLGASGLAPADVRAAATAPEFLASVMDFLLMDDAWIVRFCDAEGLAYAAPLTARLALAGGTLPHWT